MTTIENLLEEATGLNALDMMKGTEEEFETFFLEEDLMYIRELLRMKGGNWEAEVSEEDIASAKKIAKDNHDNYIKYESGEIWIGYLKKHIEDYGTKEEFLAGFAEDAKLDPEDKVYKKLEQVLANEN